MTPQRIVALFIASLAICALIMMLFIPSFYFEPLVYFGSMAFLAPGFVVQLFFGSFSLAIALYISLMVYLVLAIVLIRTDRMSDDGVRIFRYFMGSTLVFLCLACSIIYVKLYVPGIPHSRVYSPDRTRYIQFTRFPRYPLFVTSIGDGGGWTGTAALMTSKGQTLNTARFAIFNGLDREVSWSPDTVSIRSLLEWDYNGKGYTRSYEDQLGLDSSASEFH